MAHEEKLWYRTALSLPNGCDHYDQSGIPSTHLVILLQQREETRGLSKTVRNSASLLLR